MVILGDAFLPRAVRSGVLFPQPVLEPGQVHDLPWMLPPDYIIPKEIKGFCDRSGCHWFSLMPIQVLSPALPPQREGVSSPFGTCTR
jgi:hypothetical protein